MSPRAYIWFTVLILLILGHLKEDTPKGLLEET
jgi:hypothetical protein